MANITITGEYVLKRNEGFYEYLVAQGITADKAKATDLVRPVMKISVEGEDIIFSTEFGSSNISSVLKLKQEVEERIGLDMIVKSYTEIDGNRITIHSVGPNGEVGRRNFEFKENEMIMTLSSDKPNIPEAKRYYNRMPSHLS
nr:uncharacterized protein LOC111507272 [Leptinotarsa decemlineata]